jgi:hypothetical protein
VYIELVLFFFLLVTMAGLELVLLFLVSDPILPIL